MFGRIKHMPCVNKRSFLLVKPKKPFAEWVNSFDEPFVPEEHIMNNSTLYMVENLYEGTSDEKEVILQSCFKRVFEQELIGWYEAKSCFPKNITLEMFKQWFEYEFVEMCFDTMRGEIQKD